MYIEKALASKKRLPLRFLESKKRLPRKSKCLGAFQVFLAQCPGYTSLQQEIDPPFFRVTKGLFTKPTDRQHKTEKQ